MDANKKTISPKGRATNFDRKTEAEQIKIATPTEADIENAKALVESVGSPLLENLLNAQSEDE